MRRGPNCLQLQRVLPPGPLHPFATRLTPIVIGLKILLLHCVSYRKTSRFCFENRLDQTCFLRMRCQQCSRSCCVNCRLTSSSVCAYGRCCDISSCQVTYLEIPVDWHYACNLLLTKLRLCSPTDPSLYNRNWR